MSAIMSAFAHLVGGFADLLQPLFHTTATAAAIILFTALVRLAIHPLSRAAARGQKARTKLAPQIAELRKKHAKNPERMRKALMELHAAEKVSPLSGILPSLLQLPAFFLMFHLFSRGTIGGEPNGLLSHSLFAAPLGKRWADALSHGGVFGGAGLVYVALFVIVAGVATFNYVRTKRQMAASPTPMPTGADGQQVPGMGGIAKLMPLMSFATLLTVGFVPLAAGLYVVTTTAWSAAERYFLYRDASTSTSAAKTATAAKTAPTTKTAPAAKAAAAVSPAPAAASVPAARSGRAGSPARAGSKAGAGSKANAGSKAGAGAKARAGSKPRAVGAAPAAPATQEAPAASAAPAASGGSPRASAATPKTRASGKRRRAVRV